MKKIIIALAICLIFSNFALAEEAPFNQYIRVVNYTSGQAITGLNCVYLDNTILNNTNMTDAGSGYYYIQISEGTTHGIYAFDAVCTLGSENRYVSGIYEVEQKKITSSETQKKDLNTTKRNDPILGWLYIPKQIKLDINDKFDGEILKVEKNRLQAVAAWAVVLFLIIICFIIAKL